MRCSACGSDNAPTRKFCRACGAALAPVCPACATPNEPGDRFCGECGAALAGPDRATAARPPAAASTPPAKPAPATSPAEPAADRFASPGAYTPRHLADRILTSRGALEGERKQVTVLFCDLVNSTPLAERLGAEAMHELLDRFFELALAEVHRYEGTLNQFLGDGFMALFGAPLALEDHARRAVLAALGIRRRLGEVDLESTVEGGSSGQEVVVRQGLNTGPVVVGTIGDNLRMDYTAIGDTVNLAARMQQIAQPGEILLAESTARLVDEEVQLEDLGPALVKGKSEPVPVYRAVEAAPRRAPRDRLGERRLSPFVGRERDLAALEEALARAEGGEGQIVGLVGEPGVGKSRLRYELRCRLAERPVTYLEGRCISYGSGVPYLPVLEVLRSGLGLAEGGEPAETPDRVRAELAALGIDADDVAPYVLHLLGLRDGADRLAGLSPESLKARTIDLLVQLWLRTARRRPLVLVLEDLHWVDRSSEELLDTLAASLARAPILLVATYRPGYRPTWVERSYATQLPLRPLTTEDSLAVVRALLKRDDLTTDLARAILARAEGNPFFLEELTRAATDRRTIHWEEAIPDTVQGVLAARIDRLADGPKRLLQTASVLGREVSPRLLRAIWDGPDEPGPLVYELKRLEFLYERGGADEPVYLFKHALTQEAAYESLLTRRRRELHRRAADALAARQSERPGALHPILAHHYARAEAWPEALKHARVAAEAARAAYANREALEQYGRALEAAERAGAGALERLRLHEARAETRNLLGEFEAALAEYEAALALTEEGAETAGERARLLGALGMLWGGHRDYQRGLELTRQSVVAAEAAGDARASAEARVRLGVMLLNRAQMVEARRELEAALALFRDLADEPGQARTLDVLGMVSLNIGDLEAAVAYAQEAIPRLQAIGDRLTEGSALLLLGMVLAFRGDSAAGETWARRGLELLEEIGARSGEAYAHMCLGQIRDPYGDFQAVLDEAARAYQIACEVGHREWTAGSLCYLGRVRRRCGDPAGALRLHEEMLAIARELGTALWISAALSEMGEDLAAIGELEAGATHLDEAVQIGGEMSFFATQTFVARAELLLRRGRPSEALEAVDQLWRTSHQFGAFLPDARRIEGEALATSGHTEEAESKLREAKERALAIGAEPPRWRACLALGRLLETLDRPNEAAAEYAEALAALEQVASGLSDPDLRRCMLASEPIRLAREGVARVGGPPLDHG